MKPTKQQKAQPPYPTHGTAHEFSQRHLLAAPASHHAVLAEMQRILFPLCISRNSHTTPHIYFTRRRRPAPQARLSVPRIEHLPGARVFAFCLPRRPHGVCGCRPSALLRGKNSPTLRYWKISGSLRMSSCSAFVTAGRLRLQSSASCSCVSCGMPSSWQRLTT